MNVGRSRVQAASHVDPQQVPLTGYEQYPQEVRTYPVVREPVNVQPLPTNDNSALLDLPNVQMGLPTPLIPQQANQAAMESREERAGNSQPSGTSTDTVTSSQILESIQNITSILMHSKRYDPGRIGFFLNIQLLPISSFSQGKLLNNSWLLY